MQQPSTGQSAPGRSCSPPASGSTTSSVASMGVYPPNHPLSTSKHLCSICGDRASGKHYGVYSCEGCKGFFKRTVRKELTYACREDRNCLVDKRQRNRCQYCRYEKCLQMGMRREAVQEERQRSKEKRQQQGASSSMNMSSTASNDSGSERNTPARMSTTPTSNFPLFTGKVEFSVDKLITADQIMLGSFLTEQGDIHVRPLELSHILQQPEANRQLVEVCERELHLAAQYVRLCPMIGELPLSDQIALVKFGWNELHLSAMGARAMFANVIHGLVLSTGMCITPAQADLFGLSGLIERMSSELIGKMSELRVDPFELACLRGIILFNPDAKGLFNVDRIEMAREHLYTNLEEHCQQHLPRDPSRFAKLLLRLPSLRSIGLKCPEPLFFSQLFPSLPFDSFLSRLLQQPNRDLRSIGVEVENEEYHRKLRQPMLSPTTPSPLSSATLGGDFYFGGEPSEMNSAGNTPLSPREEGFGFPGYVKQEHSNPFQ